MLPDVYAEGSRQFNEAIKSMQQTDYRNALANLYTDPNSTAVDRYQKAIPIMAAYGAPDKAMEAEINLYKVQQEAAQQKIKMHMDVLSPILKTVLEGGNVDAANKIIEGLPADVKAYLPNLSGAKIDATNGSYELTPSGTGFMWKVNKKTGDYQQTNIPNKPDKERNPAEGVKVAKNAQGAYEYYDFVNNKWTGVGAPPPTTWQPYATETTAAGPVKDSFVDWVKKNYHE